MKKFLSLLLTACLAASLFAGCGVKIEDAKTTNTPKAEPTAVATKAPEPTTAPTEPAATATPTMTPTPTPDPDVVCGFKLIETRNFPLIQSDVSLYEHQKTGAKFVYIANEDTNRAFQLTFNTRPVDDTGLPHVFEHSCLCGSDKYPYDQLWWAVSYQTYNTYVNAYTTDAMTCYPVGSLSEAQLLKLAEYYTDACYHPLILQNEKIFRTEAWRYRLEKPEDEMTIEGTVYSEMQGSFTLNRFASQMAYKTAFPGSVLGFDYGGNPDHIPEMTWEALKNYHSLYYHPSNSVAFLYGKFEDPTAFLKVLDGYYENYEKSEFKFEDKEYTRLTGPVSAEYGYPMPAETDVNNTSVVEYYIIVPGLRDDIEQEHVVDNMCSLLGSTSSVLGQAMKRAFPSASFGIGRELAAEDDGICITVSNVNKGDAELIKKIVDEAFKDVAANGFAADLVDSYVASLNLSTRLSQENSNPIEGIIYSFAYDYAVTGDAFKYIENVEYLDKLAEMNNGAYQAAAQKWFVGNDLTALVTVYPDAGAKEVKDAALADKLATIKASLSKDEINAIIAETNAPAEEEDFSEAIAYLKAVDVSSLPEEVRIYDVNDVTGDDGIRKIDAVANVDGVGTASVYFDAAAVPQADIHWLRLFTRLLGKLDTTKHSEDELSVLMSRYLYDGSIGVSIQEISDELDLDGFVTYLVASWTAVDEDLDEGYDLVKELLFETKFDDKAKLLEKVQAQKTATRNSINSNPYNIALYRGLGVEIPSLRLYSYMNYVEYYQFLEQLEALLQTGSDEPGKKFAAMQEFFKNKAGAVSTFAGNKESINVNRALADAFFADMPSVTRTPAVYDIPAPAYNEALIVDSNVQFNCIIANYGQLGIEGYDAGFDAIASLVADTILVPTLRDGYGVYTPWNGFMAAYGMYLITYRDPNIRETFDTYEKLPEMIEALAIDQDTLNGYILSAYSGYAQPVGELAGAENAITTIMVGEEQGYQLEYMKQLKAVTPEKVKEAAKIYKNAYDNGVLYTAGSAGKINDNKELYDVILNPFNAKDASKVEYTDVKEGGDYDYTALRYVIENQVMAPVSDTEFGTAKNATMRDLVNLIYIFAGGSGDDYDTARAFLAGYGIVKPDEDPDQVINEKIFCDLMNLSFGFGLSTETPDAVMARGDFAEFAYQVLSQE